MNKKTSHTRLDFFPASNGELLIGNRPLSQVLARAGQTPVYLYDRELISERVRALRSALPEAISLHYAIKANPMPAVVQHLARLVDGLDVASHQEMLVALDTGMHPRHISFAGPGKTDQDLRSAIASQITINVESGNELRRIAELGKQLQLTPQIALRINPDFELKAAGMKMAGGAKPFGIDAETLPDLLQHLPNNLNWVGLHIFCGSQNLNPQALMEAHQQTFALAARLASFSAKPLDFINIGGGFGIPYFPGDEPLPLGAIANNLHTLLQHYQPSLGNSQIVMELGRYLVGEAGIYVCQVVDKKISRGQTYLVCNGGLHHHLANSGNFGQVIRKNYPVVIGNKMDSPEQETVTIVGPSCTPLDILAHNVTLPQAEVGDYVVVLQSGAYGLTASPNRFLSHPQAIEMLV